MDCSNRLFASSIKFSNPFVCSLKRLWTRKIEFYSFSLNFPLHYGSSHKPNRNCLPEPPTMFKLTRHFFFPPFPRNSDEMRGKGRKDGRGCRNFYFCPFQPECLSWRVVWVESGPHWQVVCQHDVDVTPPYWFRLLKGFSSDWREMSAYSLFRVKTSFPI